MINKELVETLEHVGFEDKEARVYLALLELGHASASHIAEKAELKRPIVYFVLERLKSRGYVQNFGTGRVKHFSAVDPSRLLATSQTAVEEFRFMLPLIHALQDKGKEKPRIEFFEGKDAIINIYNQIAKEKDVRFLTSVRQQLPIMPSEIEVWARQYENKRDARGHGILICDTPEDIAWGKRVSKGSARVRVLPKGQETAMDFSMTKEMLCITSFDPLFVVAIHSEKIARSSALLFDLAWASSRAIGEK